MNQSDTTKKVVFCAMSLAAGLVLSYIESILPINIGIPGAKIGLPNIVTVMLLYNCGFFPALTVNIMRILLSGFMFGNLFAIIYSAAGLLFSMAAMLLLKKSGLFGVTGVSCAGVSCTMRDSLQQLRLLQTDMFFLICLCLYLAVSYQASV